MDFYENENINRETLIQKVIDYEDQLVSEQMKARNRPEAVTDRRQVSSTPEGVATEVVTPTEDVNESVEEKSD